MRGRVSILVLLALGLAACGNDSQKTPNVQQVPLDSEAAQTPSSSTGPASPTAPASGKKQELAIRGTYLEPKVQLAPKKLKGKAPAVVLIPDTGDLASAQAEARSLAALGIGTFIVAGPSAVPNNPRSFNQAVEVALGAVNKLGRMPGVDKRRLGVIAEGVGAHVAAVALGREPDRVAAAVLADIGGQVVPSKQFAPERWLSRAGSGIQLLFQRDQAKRAMTSDEITRLMLAAPPGTLMQQYSDLGAEAQKAREQWIKQKLLTATA